MAVTQADIDRLNQAIAQGERQVTNGSQTITYRSAAELLSLRDDLQRQLCEDQLRGLQRRRPRRYMLTYGGRGF